MANAIYPKFKEAILQGGIDLSSVTVKALLVKTSSGYSYSSSHQYLSDISGGDRVAISPALSSKTFTNGAFKSDNPTFSGVIGSVVGAIVLFVDTGTPSTSALIMYQDTGVTGLPLSPDGSDVQIAVDAGGWFIL